MPRISLSVLALLILLATTLLYLGLGGVGYLRLQATLGHLDDRQQAAAVTELKEISFTLQARLRDLNRELVAWDEVRQQLMQPAYYGYWKENRLYTGSRLPEYIDKVELYSNKGLPLSGEVEAPLPAKIADQSGRTILVRHQGQDYLLVVEAVPDPASDGVIGYVAIATLIQEAILVLQKLHYIDVKSLRSTIPEGAQVTSSDLVNKFRYDIVPSSDAGLFKELLVNSFYQVAGVTLIVLWLFYIALMVVIGLPLRKLSKHIDRLRDDSSSTSLGISERFALKELEKIRQSLNEYQSRLEVVHRGLDRKNQRLWKLAHHDSLTGCLNRRAFEDDWRRLLKLSSERPADVSLILIDCNHFKAINDTYGHNTGDEVLKGISLTVRKILSEGDRLYRIAGDEFAVIFMDAGPDHAQHIAQRCLNSITQHGFTQFGIREPVTISIGIASTVRGDLEELKSLYRRANVAMFNAKRPGGSGISMYSLDMDGATDMALSNRAAAAVDEALNTGTNLQMHYQPVVTLPGMNIEYYESLVRVRDGDSLIKPDEFFLQVETRHLDAEFDNVIFEAVLRDLKDGKIPEGSGLSVNISAASIVSPDIEDHLSMFAPYFKRHKFILEVTETTLITQLQLASERLARLRKLGFVIALDDFGSGYSSLRYLADMPVDVVKFDISLVQALCEASPRADMLADLVAVVRGPGYKLVAEGVETEAMVQRVTELGFDYAQGYIFGEPQLLGLVAA